MRFARYSIVAGRAARPSRSSLVRSSKRLRG
jgi:hypothetical protein